MGHGFRETRFGSGRDGTSEVEVTEFVPGESIQLEDESLGSKWTTTYAVAVEGGTTRLTMTVEAATTEADREIDDGLEHERLPQEPGEASRRHQGALRSRSVAPFNEGLPAGTGHAQAELRAGA